MIESTLESALEFIADAIERQDYRTATQHLKPLIQQSPENIWVRFYVARVHEASGKTDQAERLYRQLLKSETNRKIVTASRQGIQRIQASEQEERQAAIAQATTASGRTALGGLILEPLTPDIRDTVTQDFARLMQLEPYAARLLLPTRNWRFYRTGKLGELQVYVKALKAIGVPAFCAALEDLAQIPVVQTRSLSLANGTVTVQPLAPEHPKIQFRPQEVRACLEGALPLFESVVVVDISRRKKEQYVRKEQVQDYAKVLDLHLPNQIIRLCDQTYRFAQADHQGKNSRTEIQDNRDLDALTPDARYESLPQKWAKLLRQLPAEMPEVVKSDRFKAFAATVLDQEDFLRRIQAQIELSNASALVFHDEAPPWHEAFHLYSSLMFVR